MKSIWKWLLLAVVAVTPWLRGLSYPFLYDDIGMIAENSFLEEPGHIVKVLSGWTLTQPQVINGRRPAVLATYFLDRECHGLRPAGWRVTNLLLHLANAGLLAWLVRRLTGHSFMAAASGLLFALHPLVTEPVHAPGFRADVLCLFFILAGAHLFWAEGTRATWRRTASCGLLALALLAKETAVAAPLLFAALVFLFPAKSGAPSGRIFKWLAVTFVLAGVFFVLWVASPVALQAAGHFWNGESLRFPETIFSAPALWTRTLRLLLVPWPLNVTPAFTPVTSLASLRFWVGVGWLVFCLWGIRRAYRAAPALALGLLWALIFFLPVANLFPLLHPVADRYFYPIVPGFAIAVAWLLAQQTRAARAVGLAGLLAIYALLISVRLGQWASGERLWTAAYFQNSQSATAATWLGLLRDEAGDAEGAREFYQAATKANPYAVEAWINWGAEEARAGNWAEAERLWRHAVKIRPDKASGWSNLALCLEQLGRPDEAAQARERLKEIQTPP